MGRRKAHVPLNVFLNGRLVGVLHREATGAIDFQYARDWLDWDNNFPVSLSLPLREDRYIGAPAIKVFDNLLPDGVDPGPAGAINGKPVSDDEAAVLIRNLTSAPLGLDEDEDFRISIAGAQEKTALLRMNGQWFKPVGTTATTHILKPQIGQLPNGIDLSNSVENEYLCLTLLAAFGVPTPPVEIADFGDRRTLIVERFGRRWTRDERLPQEDICQALSIPPTRKYQSDGGPGMRDIIQLLKGSDTPDEDVVTFMSACVLFWLLGATDGHAKNFSTFLGLGGRYHMTPLYDVLTSQPSLDANQIPRKKFKLAMSSERTATMTSMTSCPGIFCRRPIRQALALR